MCHFLSCIMTEKSILFSDNKYEPDSHENILIENGLLDVDSVPKFVRIEFRPPIIGATTDFEDIKNFDNWVFHVDQDFRPDWFLRGIERDRLIKHLNEVCHIVNGVWRGPKNRVMAVIGDVFELNDEKIPWILSSAKVHIVRNCDIDKCYGYISTVCGRTTIVEAHKAKFTTIRDSSIISNMDDCEVFGLLGMSYIGRLDGGFILNMGDRSRVRCAEQADIKAMESSCIIDHAWNSKIGSMSDDAIVRISDRTKIGATCDSACVIRATVQFANEIGYNQLALGYDVNARVHEIRPVGRGQYTTMKEASLEDLPRLNNNGELKQEEVTV